MNDFKTNPTGKPQPDWEAVHRVERVDQKKEEPSTGKGPQKNHTPLLMGGFCAFIKKTFSLLTDRRLRGQILSIEHLGGILQHLRSLLWLLSTEDHSHDPKFIEQISDTWHTLMELSKNHEWKAVNHFIYRVLTYPPGDEHSMGFYLAQSTGKEWFPFPFMDLLQALHKQYLEKKEHSELHAWLKTLDELIKSLASIPS